MKFGRTQVALVLGAGVVFAAGWLVATPSSQPPAPMSSAQAAISESSTSEATTSGADSASATSSDAMAQSASAAVASLGDVAVTQDEMEELLRTLPPATREQLKENRPALDQWLRARLAEEALLSQALAQGWTERPEVKRMTDAAQRQVVLQTYLDSVSQVPADYPSQDELQAAYEANKAQFTTPAQYRVSQLFLAAPFQDGEAVASAREKAEELAAQARADDADFDAIVKEHSEDESTAARGGDTGWVPLQQLLPEMRATVAELEKGAVSEPVQSQAGFHVLKLVDQRDAEALDLTVVQSQLRDALRQQRKGTVAQAYMEGLVEAGTLSIDGATLNAAFDAVP